METKADIVEALIRAAGRRAEPPPGARQRVLAAAFATLRDTLARRRRRRRGLGAALAASLVLAVVLVAQWPASVVPPGRVASIERAVGGVEYDSGAAWLPVGEARASLGTGRRLRTLGDGRAALVLAGGESLRIAPDTEILLDAPGRVYVERGTIYVDSGARPTSHIEVVTRVGTARDLGTQFELSVDGAALRLRVREGMVAIDRGGRSHRGSAGEELTIDEFGTVGRGTIAPDAEAWRWAESLASMPETEGRPASELIAWVARESGLRLRYESPLVERHAASLILHGRIRHVPPLTALAAMLATTDLEYELEGATMQIRARNASAPEP